MVCVSPKRPKPFVRGSAFKESIMLTTNMYRSILVPLDGSSFGEHALPLALRLARQSGAALQIVHVHGSPAPLYAEGDPAYSAEVDAAMRKSEQAYLDRILERLANRSRTPVQAALLEGPIGEALE